MASERDEMIKVLKSILIPLLREKGFKGTFPHFRRRLDTRIDLFSIFFDKYGGGFIVEIGASPINGFSIKGGPSIPPDKVNTTHHVPYTRLEPTEEHDSFRYDEEPVPDNIYEKLVYEVVSLLPKAEEWWNSDKIARIIKKKAKQQGEINFD
ncbi:DUF4304 domain-containing protein [Fictibacillus sp. NPDC058756]|uniref:DUF4304 domain-containing protein n=1 Tax=Fictibacillus sp. NPDC058756 TaxID=3346625 RepID=UPI0036944987